MNSLCNNTNIITLVLPNIMPSIFAAKLLETGKCVEFNSQIAILIQIQSMKLYPK